MHLYTKEEPTVASAMADLATQVYAVFVVAVALGSPWIPPGPANTILKAGARLD